MNEHFEMKDEKLNSINKNNIGNIAQFISFGIREDMDSRYIHINKNIDFGTIEIKELICNLIESSNSQSVNIRKYNPENMKGNKLIFNKKFSDIDEIINVVKTNKDDGYYTIINENIDINDGGVSGVVLGDVIEFSPKDTPKCVDKEGICSLPKSIGFEILRKVYGFEPEINFSKEYRVEFSIHPTRQGVEKKNTIIWEYEFFDKYQSEIKIKWPNNFSTFIGDKTFGLLIADSLGLKVPKTTVISRNVAPFAFGLKTGIHEKWIRTCPITKQPGKFYTGDSWIDPFKLINDEEKKGDENINIASILSQDAVNALYSGAAIIKEKIEEDIIEGTEGNGDLFMIGEKEKSELPSNVILEVKKLNSKIRSFFNYIGEVSIEWVYDGCNVWVVQLNQLKTSSYKNIIVDGDVSYYEEFEIRKGLEELRCLIDEVKDTKKGIELIGNIGITSHFGDLLRLAMVPSRIKEV